MTHAYDDLITGSSGCTDYWRLDRDTDELANLKNTLRSDLTSSGVTSGSTAENILPGTNNLYSDYFDGTDDYVTGTTYQYATISMSVALEAWIKPASIDTGIDFVGLVVKSGSFGLYLNYGKFAFFTQLSGQSKVVVSDSVAASADTVYHVVGSYNSSTGHHSIYVNGVEVDYLNGSTGSQTDDINVANLTIGSWDTSVLFFNGRISNVALYNLFMDETTANDHYTWNA